MMKHLFSRSTAARLASIGLWVAACDKVAEQDPSPTPSASAEAQAVANPAADVSASAKIQAKDFDLEAVASVVAEGKLESAAALEVIINDEARGINHIDIDADGKIDHVQVVEVEGDAKGDAEVVLELRVVPSSSGSVDAAVVFATTSFTRHSKKSEVEIRTGFTAVVVQPEVVVYTDVVPVKVEAGVVVGGSVFLSWVFAVDRSVYVGVYAVDEHGYWIPPGHLKHGHWKAKGHGHGHGGAAVVIDVHGSAGIHFSGSGHGGGKSKGGKGKGGKGKGGKGK